MIISEILSSEAILTSIKASSKKRVLQEISIGISKKKISILDVGCLTGHFNRTFNKFLKKEYTYTGIDPWKIHIDAANKVWKNSSNTKFKIG